MVKILVLHQYGAPSHYVGLNFLSSVRVEYAEFDVGKQCVKMFLHRAKFKRFRANLKALFRLSSYEKIILGIAPGDLNLLWLTILLGRGRVIWHTSWCNFESKWPRGFNNDIYKSLWLVLLNNRVSDVAYVNDMAAPYLSLNFESITQVYHSVIIEPKADIVRRNAIIYVGRKENSKGWSDFKEIAASGHDEWIFECAGFRGESKDINITNLGFLDKERLSVLYSSSKFLLNLSHKTDTWEEVFGLAMAEAIVCGCKVIAYDSPGSRMLQKAYPSSVFIVDDKLSIWEVVARDYTFALEENNFNVERIASLWESLIF